MAGGLLLWVAGCRGPQSVLDPAGQGAEDIADLFQWMAVGAVVIWVVVIALAVYALRSGTEHDRRLTSILVIGGGAVVPTVVLTVLLCFGLALLPELQRPAPEGSLTIAVQGEQFWWRVRYLDQDGQEFETANEIRLPVDEPVEFKLTSPDVIHSFWIPSIGGKMDTMPGRQTRLKLHPTRTGQYRGACAEYCGSAHAQMVFIVDVVDRAEFDQWRTQQLQQAQPPADEASQQGWQVFQLSGCGACHTIRGTTASGGVGPDLTHVGNRPTVSGVLPNDADGFTRWIRDTHAFKPGAWMPSFTALSETELRSLAEYLEQLQ